MKKKNAQTKELFAILFLQCNPDLNMHSTKKNSKIQAKLHQI
jgi:hypothetical protein